MTDYTLANQLTNIHNKQPWLVINAAQKFSLAKSSSPLISHFYSFETNKSMQTAFAIPDGCVDILFDCDSHRPIAEVFRTPLEAMDIELNSNRRYFGVRFNSAVMPNFLNISASEMINKHHQLSDLIPQFNQLVEQVASDFNFTNQVALFSHFINTKKVKFDVTSD